MTHTSREVGGTPDFILKAIQRLLAFARHHYGAPPPIGYQAVGLGAA
ncbi:Uncharacterised protein [Mycobacteroides abscessus subsp. abscessus]|nr:Uncharacterised protein [Mycobacteroides abscessus subsp. abscessus]SKV14612.1 Uncharacterised protein [Mycobacteroides abscessus subsp. abscessus]